MMNLKNKKVMVIGLRRSGVAAAKFLVKQGAIVTVNDKAEASGFAAEIEALKGFDLRFVFGRHDMPDFTGSDLIVISPGIPLDIPPLEAARNSKVEIIGELELAARFINIPMIGITGTNGKSTVTTLTGLMLQESGKDVFVGGNIGNPLINLAGNDLGKDAAVVEMSSFQLESIDKFRPRVGVMMNITPDHLDRYHGMKAYIEAKARIWKNMTADDWAVVNAGCSLSLESLKGAKCRVLYFNVEAIPEQSPRAYLDKRTLVIEYGGKTERIDASGIKIAGLHNLENAIASAAAALIAGAHAQGIKKAIDTYAGLPHRTEFVRELNGVKYYDDSKGTNIGAMQKSLAGFDSPIVLIAGGLDKAGDFTALRQLVKERVKAIVLIGSAAKKIYDALGDVVPTHNASDMQDAVRKSRDLAAAGEVVLLSPGCASFDMFRDYNHRGEVFKEAVLELK